MGTVITIHDTLGEREHDMVFGALKVEYKGKIGTVVVIDIKVADIPRDLGIDATMDPESILLEASATGWTVSNAAGESYSGHVKLFFLSVKDGQFLVHA